MIPEPDEEYSTFILMDWIPGDCLGEIWHSLPKQDDIVARVFEMLQALKNVALDTPGPVGGGKCHGFCFSDDGAGPFASTREMKSDTTSECKYVVILQGFGMMDSRLWVIYSLWCYAIMMCICTILFSTVLLVCGCWIGGMQARFRILMKELLCSVMRTIRTLRERWVSYWSPPEEKMRS
jgi:hypothetical protein